MPWTEQELAEMQAFDAELNELEAEGKLRLTYDEYVQSDELDSVSGGRKRGSAKGLTPQEYRKKYYMENHGRILAYKRQRYENNKERVREYQRQWYENNKEHAREYQRQRYENNKEHVREYKRQWYENNKERVREYKRQYRAKKAREAGGEGKGI